MLAQVFRSTVGTRGAGPLLATERNSQMNLTFGAMEECKAIVRVPAAQDFL